MESHRILVTGDTGLIGRHVVDYFSRAGSECIGLRRAAPHLDLLEPDSVHSMLRLFNPAVVIHAAWNASGTSDYRHARDQFAWSSTTSRLIQSCVERNINVYILGSVAEIDNSDCTFYGQARQELWNREKTRVHAGEITWFRIHYVLAPADDRPELIRLLRSAKAKGANAVNLQRPTERHDFIHVNDVAAAIHFSVRHKVTGLIDLGSGVVHSVEEVALAMGVSVSPSWDSPQVDDSTPAASTSILRSVGWFPSHTLNFFS